FFRYGDYGKQLEFLKPRRDPKKSYHIFIYSYDSQTQKFNLKWGSSTIQNPLVDFKIIFENGRYILDGIEGSYADYDNLGFLLQRREIKLVWNEWWMERIN